MNRIEKILASVFTLIFGVAVLLFFGIQYRYHIHYQEQYQLFEYTAAYFWDVVSSPGGLSDYIGRFLTQFFYYAWAGSAIFAFLLCGMVLSSYAVLGRKGFVPYMLCFVPAFLMWIYLCDENSLCGAPVALILSLVSAVSVSRIRNVVCRRVSFLTLTVVLYFLAGPVSVAFALTASGRDKWWMPLAASVLMAVLPVLIQYVSGYSLERLYTGVHYHRFHNVIHVMLWLSVLSTVVLALLSRIPVPSLKSVVSLVAGCVLFAALCASAPFIIRSASDFLKEEQMEYDFMANHRMWNRIMMKADVNPPHTPMTVTCLNLALAMSGRMEEHQFDYFQNGPDGLFPPFVRDFTSPLATAEVYYHIGMVNTAQRYTFEAQESIPDFQKSARCYRRLAETNYINGDIQVAEKYLEALRHTLFYRQWASGFADSPEYGRLRRLRLKDHDFLFSQPEMDSMLGLLYVENKDNLSAFDYLLSWCLLSKDLDRFEECLHLRSYKVLPKPYQEALLLRLALKSGSVGSLPPYLVSSYYYRLQSFLWAYQRGTDMSRMQKDYGDTYWFYYYFRYNGKDEKMADTGSGSHGGSL